MTGRRQGRNLSSYSAQYLVNSLIKQIHDDGGNVTDMTVAVIINSAQMTDEEIAKYKELVAFSVGVPTDKVALTYSRFVGRDTAYPVPVTDEEPEYIFGFIDKNLLIIIGISVLGLTLLTVAVVVIVKRSKNNKRKRKLEELERQLKEQAEKKPMPGEIVLNETREQALKRQIKEFSAQHAETVAKCSEWDQKEKADESQLKIDA